jgi:hypothetical protein|tara:strand:- start:295 stop:537 length:243 start_codon:yes stop_codon:yes gene_type:complete
MQNNRERHKLGKYDAPLIIQFKRGVDDFYRGRVSNPFHKDTMQYREWERGFNKAYFEKVRKVIRHEQNRTTDTTRTRTTR